MSKLSELQGKVKVCKIGDVDIEIHPLTLEDMGLFNIDEKASSSEQIDMTKKMIMKSIPGSTDSEVNLMGIEYMQKLTEAIMEVNGLNQKTSNTDKIKNAIKARQPQEQIKE